MAKRPTPKKRRAKSKGRNQYSVYEQKEVKRLINRQNSPFAVLAERKNKASRTLRNIRRIKA